MNLHQQTALDDWLQKLKQIVDDRGGRVADKDEQTGNVSGADSSDSCSDDEMNGHDQEPLSVFVTPDHEVFSSISPPSSPIEIKCTQRPSPSRSLATKTSSVSTSQGSILSPLMYQTPQGMMYATPSNGGVLLSLAQGDPNNKTQFITIPLSM
ncbi:hypothetical protein YQE_09615, partial [Dendroctonus ponderosae]